MARSLSGPWRAILPVYLRGQTMSLFLMMAHDDAPAFIVGDERQTPDGWQTETVRVFRTEAEAEAEQFIADNAHLYNIGADPAAAATRYTNRRPYGPE